MQKESVRFTVEVSSLYGVDSKKDYATPDTASWGSRTERNG